MKIDCIRINRKEDFEKISQVWEKLEIGSEMTVFQSLKWNKLLYMEWYNYKYNRLFSKVEVYVIENENDLMIVPTIIQLRDTYLKGVIGRRRGIYILGQGSYSDYLNFVYNAFSETMVLAFINHVREKYSDYKLYFSNVREDTMLCKYLNKNYKWEVNTVSVSLNVPKNKEEFDKMLSKHTRQNLRTALNRMNKDLMQYEWCEKGIIVDDTYLNKLVKLHMKRMKTKNSDDSSFLNKIKAEIKLQLLLYREKNNNIVRESMCTMKNSFILIVKLKGNLVGYIYGLKESNGIIRIMQNCIDEEYKFYSPMFRGIYDYIAANCGESELREIDFTRGDEDYKYKLGGQEVSLYNFKI